MTKASLQRWLERDGVRALQTSTMPCEIRVEFCHARDGRPAGTSVFGADGQLVRLEPPEGCGEGPLVMEEEQRGSESDGRISGATTIARFPAELQCLFHASRYKIIYGGRGSGKSWSVARTLLLRGTQRPLRILCGREFQNSIADSVHRLLADQIELLHLSGFYRVEKAAIIGANGTEFRFAGIRHNISKLKSFEGFDIVWIEEAQTVSKDSFDVLIPTIRKAGSEIWITFNPDLEENDVWQRFLVEPPRADAIIQQVNWMDNRWLTDELRAEKDHLKARDLDAYQNVWEGQCRSHVQNALWKKEIFEANREPAPETETQRKALVETLQRVVIGVDPSGCMGEDDKRSDEVGIVAVGLGYDGIGRILEDATGRYSPDEWANKAIEIFDRWKADKIVAEKNFGGEMVRSTIRTARQIAPIKLVTASRGKVQRAEPVAAIYDQGKVRHVGHFAELERQYCHFSTAGYMGARSPDHADAAIWALTELMIDPEPEPNIRFPDIWGTSEDPDDADDEDDAHVGFRRPTSAY